MSGPAGQPGVIYLLHFSRPYKHARQVQHWTDDLDARGRAKGWASSLETHWEDAWLILNIGGRGITLKPGEF